ncbi:MAG: hypothetical protein ACOX4I_00400 [Anaerovoracaceae bacterium]|jgi:hypothetical protein
MNTKNKSDHLSRNKALMYWMLDDAWYVENKETPYGFEMTKEAPKRAIESFEEWKKNWEWLVEPEQRKK